MASTSAQQYVAALWKNWQKLLTGGAIIAVLTMWGFTGRQIYPVLGASVLVATFVLASYGAWLEEHVGRDVRVQITGLLAQTIQPGVELLTLYVRLTNPNDQPISFETHWTLELLGPDGTRITLLPGGIKGEIRPLQRADAFNVSMIFPCVDCARQPETRFVLRGTDIYGNAYESPFPQP